MAKGEAAQQQKKKRRRAEPGAAPAGEVADDGGRAPVAAAAQPAQPEQPPPEPTGWEELDAPQDVQQQAGECKQHLGTLGPGAGQAGRHAWRRRQPPPRAACRRTHRSCLASGCAAIAATEPAQQEEHRKLSKHAKKRARDDRERAIRDAELRRLQVGLGAGPNSRISCGCLWSCCAHAAAAQPLVCSACRTQSARAACRRHCAPTAPRRDPSRRPMTRAAQRPPASSSLSSWCWARPTRLMHGSSTSPSSSRWATTTRRGRWRSARWPR